MLTYLRRNEVGLLIKLFDFLTLVESTLVKVINYFRRAIINYKINHQQILEFYNRKAL